jgi:thiol:disulfide interchange protein DsbA
MIQKILLASVLLLVGQVALAQQGEVDKFQEGTHYIKIGQVPAASEDDAIEITEVFSYLCSHCNSLEPYIENWQKKQPANVKFNRIHVDFGGASSLMARGYIAAEMTGIADQSHPAMMDAIWKQRKQFRNADQLADFYANFGVEKDRYLANYNSFALDSQMRRSMQNVKTYGVTGTPCIIVNQKYLVPNTPVIMDVVDFLIARETAAQPAP